MERKGKSMDVKTIFELIEKARTAQKEFETFSQEKVDQAVRAIGKAIFTTRVSL